MSRLVKPIMYAKEQNISRQAVYAQIKKGILPSKTIDGKIYIVLDEEEIPPTPKNSKEKSRTSPSQTVNIKELLASKEESISILKESIQDLKATNREINTTLREEIGLLKQVFMEMRSLYVKQLNALEEQHLITLEGDISHPQPTQEDTDQQEKPTEECWINLETFLDRANIHKAKKRDKIKRRLLKAYQQEDPRVILKENELFMSCYDFYEDILKPK